MTELKPPRDPVEAMGEAYELMLERIAENYQKFEEKAAPELNHMLADTGSNDWHAIAGRATIKSVLDSLQVDHNKPSLLLHHSPYGINYATKAGIDLYLTGHTHGGQLFPITLIGSLIYDFNKGLHDHQGTKIYVGEGAGTFGPPMRTGTNSTLTVVTLKPAGNGNMF